MMRLRIFTASLAGLLLVASVTACGKRGDPSRPSEIPAKSQSATPAS